jgi:hypothetical protein
MRCEVDQCRNDARPDRIFCVVHGRGSNTESEQKTDSSSSQTASGEASRAISSVEQDEGSHFDSNIETTGKNSIRNDGKMQKKISNEPTRGDEIGIEETRSSNSSKSTDDAGTEILLVDSIEQRKSLDKARFQSMNLLDDTASHLIDYLKSVGKDCERQEQLRDFRQINAIANIGKTIAQVAKVKLEAIKEARRIE